MFYYYISWFILTQTVLLHKLQAGRELRTVCLRLLFLCHICKAVLVHIIPSSHLCLKHPQWFWIFFRLHSCRTGGFCCYKNPGMRVTEGSISWYFAYCMGSGEHSSSQLPALLRVMALQIILSLYLCCFSLVRKAVKTPSLPSERSESQT